jgi:hypothetical protein
MPHFIVVTIAPMVIGSNAAQQVATAKRCSQLVVRRGSVIDGGESRCE